MIFKLASSCTRRDFNKNNDRFPRRELRRLWTGSILSRPDSYNLRRFFQVKGRLLIVLSTTHIIYHTPRS